MTTMGDVLTEIFNQPTNNWPVKFREWIFELTHEMYQNTHGFNVAETDEEVREYASEALKTYIGWLQVESLNSI